MLATPASAGEEKTIELTFPQNYGGPELAGKAVQFAIKAHTVEEQKLPELDDEFCKSYGVEEGGIDRLRQEVEDNMRRELTDAIRARVKKQVLDALLAANPVELPKSVVDQQVRDLFEFAALGDVQDVVAAIGEVVAGAAHRAQLGAAGRNARKRHGLLGLEGGCRGCHGAFPLR